MIDFKECLREDLRWQRDVLGLDGFTAQETRPGQRSGEDRRAKGGGGGVCMCVCVSEAVSVLSLKIGQLITARDTESLRLSCDLYITWEANNCHVYDDVAMDKQRK